MIEIDRDERRRSHVGGGVLVEGLFRGKIKSHVGKGKFFQVERVRSGGGGMQEGAEESPSPHRHRHAWGKKKRITEASKQHTVPPQASLPLSVLSCPPREVPLPRKVIWSG